MKNKLIPALIAIIAVAFAFYLFNIKTTKTIEPELSSQATTTVSIEDFKKLEAQVLILDRVLSAMIATGTPVSVIDIKNSLIDVRSYINSGKMLTELKDVFELKGEEKIEEIIEQTNE